MSFFQIEEEDELQAPVLSYDSGNSQAYALSVLSGAEQAKIGEVSLICSDPFYFRIMMEIFGDLVGTGKYRFHDNSMSMNHANDERTVGIYMYIKEEGLLDYSKYFTSGEYAESFKNIPATARLDLRGATKTLKAYAKKDKLIMSASIKESGKIPEIICQSSGEEYDVIRCDMNNDGDDNYDLINPLSKYYSDMKPTCKTTMNKLGVALTKYKSAQCDKLTFTLVDDSIVIAGIRNGIATGATKCTKGGVLSEYEQQTPEIFQIGGGSIVVSDYVVSVNYDKCSSWMVKIARLAHQNSIISIYMREGAPVVITADISFFGIAVFLFRDDRSI